MTWVFCFYQSADFVMFEEQLHLSAGVAVRVFFFCNFFRTN